MNTPYIVEMVITVDHPEKRNATLPKVLVGARCPGTASCRTQKGALHLYQELQSDAWDTAAEPLEDRRQDCYRDPRSAWVATAGSA